jgi:hypothetical protein
MFNDNNVLLSEILILRKEIEDLRLKNKGMGGK